MMARLITETPMSWLDLRFLAAPAIVAVATLSTPALAQDLKVGSDAPAISVDWVQGEVGGLDNPNKTYVVEFWATWCGPCMRSIPHLNELHQKHRAKGLVIIGISDEPMGTVRPFVSRKGSAMSYPVAVDMEKKTNQDWMQAAKQNGIPCAFIVRGGKVKWIGNPLDKQFDTVLLSVLSGRYNPELQKKAEPILKAAGDAVRMKNFKDAYNHLDAVVALDATVFGDVTVRKYRTMLVDAGDAEGAKNFGSRIIGRYSDDNVTLTELATMIATDDRIKERDFELALAAAEQVVKNSPSGDASGLALKALILHHAGRNDEAAEMQYEAWMAADPGDKADYKRVLDAYKKAPAAKAKAGS
jgi:thiol-disulfide isomerase/thioredoxin